VDHINFIHRLSIGQKPEDFFFIGGLWSEQNPDWHVSNWNESCFEDFTDLRPVIDLLKNQPSRLETLIGIALVEKWGGVFVHHEVMPPFPISRELPSAAWMNYNKNIIGSAEPGDPFWHTYLSLLPSRYLPFIPRGESTLDHFVEQTNLSLEVVA
jgi:hypothetical protein